MNQSDFSFSPKILAVAVASAMTLTACGGGGGAGAVASATSSSISGVAATGAPIAGGTVMLTDANGKTATAALTDASGNYQIDVTGLTAPFLLAITSPTTPTYHSIALSTDVNGTVDISPLTELMVANMTGVPGSTLESCKTSANACTFIKKATSATIAAAEGIVLKMLKGLKDASGNTLTADGLTASIDLRTGILKAGSHQGIDGILDQVALNQTPAQGVASNLVFVATGANLGTVTLNGNGATPTVNNPGPSATDLNNASKVQVLISEVANTVKAFNGLYATALPSAADIGLLLSSSYLNNGTNRTAEITKLTTTAGSQVGMKVTGGRIAPFDLSPLPDSSIATKTGAGGTATLKDIISAAVNRSAIIKDVNGCVTSAWIIVNVNGTVKPMRVSRTIQDPATCTGKLITLSNGSTITWTLDGNQRDLVTSVTPAYSYNAAAANPYSRMIQVRVSANGTGAGVASITMMANGVNSSVALGGTPFAITSSGYADNLLLSCADTAATIATYPNKPCFDNTANAAIGTVADGQPFVFSYTDPKPGIGTVYQIEKLASAPLPVTSLSSGMFPTGVTPNLSLASFVAALNALAAGGTSSISTTATLPSGYSGVNDIYFSGLSVASSTATLNRSSESVAATVAKPANPVSNSSVINVSIGGQSNGQIFFTSQKMQ